MRLFIDTISGDELFSDAFPVKEMEGRYEVECQMISVNRGVEVDLGEESDTAAAAEDSADSEQVLNVAHAHRLVETSFDKKSYTIYIKGYLKRLKATLSETNPEAAEGFERESAALAKEVLANFDDYRFYTGAGMNVDGMVALLNHRDGGTTPYLTFFKHGLRVEDV
ncbi:translationally-controlled tumor protein [Streptomyces sp. NPDC059072]|uniref:translationally-controlled tumor protein n=1 Tax=Streptomyces sp. NPDC059072 TaxID=3346715 RepID=UPI0036A373ED